MVLESESGIISAHCPNTGRMEEFLIPGNPFYLVPASGKYRYKVVSTLYNEEYILIDTLMYNRIAAYLIDNDYISFGASIHTLKREVKMADSRFDLFISTRDFNAVVEVKSCTLCHNGILMFPDAPTERGLKHIDTLDIIPDKTPNLKSYLLFLTTHSQADIFVPNLHTDYDYFERFQSIRKIQTMGISVAMSAPTTLDLSTLANIPIISEPIEELRNSGNYLLLMVNPEDTRINYGKGMGTIFRSGFYIYVGSAKKNLLKRVARHKRRKKTKHWHIDYIVPNPMNLLSVYLIRGKSNLEAALAASLSKLSDGTVTGFGAGDSTVGSHLFYFKNNPKSNHRFQQLLLHYRTLRFQKYVSK